MKLLYYIFEDSWNSSILSDPVVWRIATLRRAATLISILTFSSLKSLFKYCIITFTLPMMWTDFKCSRVFFFYLSCKTQRWPYSCSAYIMQSNWGLRTVLMKPTAFRCKVSCLGKQTSASQINGKTGEPKQIFRSQAWMWFSLSSVLAECIVTLTSQYKSVLCPEWLWV